VISVFRELFRYLFLLIRFCPRRKRKRKRKRRYLLLSKNCVPDEMVPWTMRPSRTRKY
jgi:hypothetical protein